MAYSQGNEEQIISDYFGQFKGTLLSIGENDGKTLSNVLACIERGWSGTLVEPSITAFNKLFDRHLGNKNVQCFNVAIADENGLVDFYESGTHLNKGDTSLLSSLKKEETARWTKEEFTHTSVNAITINQLLAISKYKIFDLISIDAEGYDLDILQQIDLSKTKMVIVESNSIDNYKYIEYCEKFGMKLHYKNYMNLIFVRHD